MTTREGSSGASDEHHEAARRFQMGQERLREGDWDGAFEFFTHALDDEPTPAYSSLRVRDMPELLPSVNISRSAILCARSRALVQLRRLPDALSDLNEAVTLSPEDVSTRVQRADVLESLQLFDDALRDRSEAIRLNTASADLFASRAWLFSRLGRFEDALSDHTEALRLDPDNPYRHRNLGWVCDDLGRYEDAIQHFGGGILLDPTIASLWDSRGFSLLCLGNFEESEKNLTRALELDEKSFAPAVNRKFGLLWYLQQKYEKSIQSYTQSIQLSGKNVHRSHYLRAYTFVRLQEFEKALDDFTMARSLGPSEEVVDRVLSGEAYCLLCQDDVEGAKARLGEIENLDCLKEYYVMNEKSRAFWCYSVVHATRGEFEEAVRALESSFAADPDFAGIAADLALFPNLQKVIVELLSFLEEDSPSAEALRRFVS